MIQYNPYAKVIPIRSEPYKKFIRKQPCLACNVLIGIQCAHENFGNSGMGTKAPDIQVIPLCECCHTAEHNRGHISFWQNHLDLDFGIPDEYIPVIIDAYLAKACLGYINKFITNGGVF